MNSPTVQEVAGGILVGVKVVGRTETGLVPIRGCPVDVDPFTGADASPPKHHVPRGDAPIGNQGGVHPKDFVNGSWQLLWCVPELLLEVGVLGQVCDEDPGARRHRGEFADGPIAQDGHQFLVAERHAVDAFSQQLRGDVVGRPG